MDRWDEMDRRDFLRTTGLGIAGWGLTFWGVHAALGDTAWYKDAGDAARGMLDIVRKRYDILAAFVEKRDELYKKESIRVGKWILETPHLSVVSGELAGKTSRGLFRLFRECNGRSVHIGDFLCSDRVFLKKLQNGGRELVAQYPHPKFNLTSGGKLKPGLWTGKMKLILTPESLVIEHDVAALADSVDFNIGLLGFDEYDLDDAYMWDSPGGDAWRGRCLDLGLDFSMSDVGAAVKCPEWAGKPDRTTIALVTRDGLGLRIRTDSMILEGAQVVNGNTWQGKSISMIGGNHWRLGTGESNANVEYRDIRKGARIRIRRTLEGFDERDTAALPPDRLFAPLRWDEARLFDSHGHFSIHMPIEKLVRMNRKNKTIFGVLSIEYIPGYPGGRAFLGDYPVYEAMLKYPDVIVGLGLIPASNNGFPGCRGSVRANAQSVDILHALGFRGLKTMEKWDSKAILDDPAMFPVYERAQKMHMPIVNHNNGGYMCMSGTGRIANQALKQPQGISVAAHATAEEKKHVENLRNIPNLYWQHMHINKADHLAELRKAGVQRKIVFGTDNQQSPTGHIRDGSSFIGNMKEAGWTDDEIHWSCAGYALNWVDYPGTSQPSA